MRCLLKQMAECSNKLYVEKKKHIRAKMSRWEKKIKNNKTETTKQTTGRKSQRPKRN